jgi:hypothetical protein
MAVALKDFNKMTKDELLSYQTHIQNLLQQHYLKECQAVDTGNLEIIKKVCNLDVKNDMSPDVWAHFWNNKEHLDIDENNIDLYIFLSGLDGFDDALEKHSNDSLNYLDFTFLESMMLFNMYDEKRADLFEKMLSHEKFNQALQNVLDNKIDEFYRKGSFNQTAMDMLVNHEMISLDNSFDAFNGENRYIIVRSNRGLLSLWETALRHHQLPLQWDEPRIRDWVIHHWHSMEIKTLNVMVQEYFQDSPLSFQEFPSLIGENQNSLGAILKAKLNETSDNPQESAQDKKVIQEYAFLLNRNEDYANWIINLPHDNWKCLNNFIPVFIKGLAEAYSDNNLEDLPQTNRNLYTFLSSIRQENAHVYEKIQLATPDVIATMLNRHPDSAEGYQRFINEFGKISLSLKLNSTLIEQDNTPDDTPSFKV